nr:aspartyl-phosphate phosphatase Spo0E family protein [Brevibacillus brevis]
MEKNDLLDDEVVELSQQLDQYILEIQSRMMQKNRNQGVTKETTNLSTINI